jgi:DNA-binding transcriptional MerR regulator
MTTGSSRAVLGRKALATAARVHPETLRYYESEGLIERPPRADNGYRRYPRAAVERVRFIQEVKGLGFTLKEIREIVSLRGEGVISCRTSATLADRKIRELDDKIAALRAVKHRLRTFLARCQRVREDGPCQAFTLLDGG